MIKTIPYEALYGEKMAFSFILELGEINSLVQTLGLDITNRMIEDV